MAEKRPGLLIDILAVALKRHADLTADIFGKSCPLLEQKHSALPEEIRQRITLHGYQSPETIAPYTLRSQILLCPSPSESGPFVLFEALSGGASAVALNTPYLPGFIWAARVGNADLADHDTPASYADAIDRALQKWANGTYQAEKIRAQWKDRTSVENYLGYVFEQFGLKL